MNTKSISAFFKKIETQMVKHSPEILTGIGITGMITAGVMAVICYLRFMKKKPNLSWTRKK